MPTKVTVFIGWSRPRSKAVATAFRDWLPQVIQAAEPWLSESMDRGAQWFAAIGTHLKTAAYGIICVTPENADEPWVLFEAGALAIHTSERLACPYLLDMTPAALAGPLGQLQAATADRDGTWQVVQTINNLLDEGVRLQEDRLRRAFDKWWLDLESKIKAARDMAHEPPAVRERSVEEKVDEILEAVRALQRSQVRVFDTAVTPDQAGLLADAINKAGWSKNLGLGAFSPFGVDPFNSMQPTIPSPASPTIPSLASPTRPSAGPVRNKIGKPKRS